MADEMMLILINLAEFLVITVCPQNRGKASFYSHVQFHSAIEGLELQCCEYRKKRVKHVLEYCIDAQETI